MVWLRQSNVLHVQPPLYVSDAMYFFICRGRDSQIAVLHPRKLNIFKLQGGPVEGVLLSSSALVVLALLFTVVVGSHEMRLTH